MEPIEDANNYEDEFVKYSDKELQSEEKTETPLKNFCDLSIIGKIWIQALKAILVGAQFSSIPVVHAEEVEETPKKPPKMKYKELPIYTSPHRDYKDYMECKDKCPDRDVKLLQRALLPYVTKARQKCKCAYCSVFCTIKCKHKDICKSLCHSKEDFKKTMRDPNNLQMRQGVVAGGTLAGFLLGGGGGIPRRVFFTSLGALATGSLCFPKETDETFRNVAYHVGTFVVAVYNMACKKDFALRERLPCKDDLPPEPKPRKPVCPSKRPTVVVKDIDEKHEDENHADEDHKDENQKDENHNDIKEEEEKQ
ncbi:hypothetical protein ABMA27_011012 [Loxostege sticticalis]|uniref:MICOS complex subunit n=1 Tax=Loxostege sticticalis TaxID=481309 RepID=A0ABR3H325_LOXSC